MSDTPRTDAECMSGETRYTDMVHYSFAQQLERELAEAREENKRLIQDMILHERMASTFQDERDRLAEAGQAVVDRWHTPLWKDAPHTAGFIQNLADALAAVKGGPP